MAEVLSIQTRTYMCKHWKLFIHLVLHTKRFGVNNEWWSRWDSDYGWPTLYIVWSIMKVRPIIVSFKLMLVRAFELGFLHPSEARKLVPFLSVLEKYFGMDLKFVKPHIWTQEAIDRAQK